MSDQMTNEDVTPKPALEEMERVGIGRALATHASAIETDIMGGNGRTSELAAQHPRFEACYVVVPHHTGEMPGGDALVRYLEDGGARAARRSRRSRRRGYRS